MNKYSVVTRVTAPSMVFVMEEKLKVRFQSRQHELPYCSGQQKSVNLSPEQSDIVFKDKQRKTS